MSPSEIKLKNPEHYCGECEYYQPLELNLKRLNTLMTKCYSGQGKCLESELKFTTWRDNFCCPKFRRKADAKR